jgi:predicted neutral ceramidase superfamily lipid hydrolase
MIFLELIEAYFQRANTLGEMIDRLYVYYNKSVFLFFISHPTFYFVLCVALHIDSFNFYILAILLFKVFDLFFKIEMIKQRYQEENMDSELSQMLNHQIAPWMGLLGLFTYVPLLFMAISS